MIETVFTLALVVQLLVPGAIASRVRQRFFVLDDEPQIEQSMLNYFMVSLILLAITWPLFAAIGGFDPIGALIAAKDASAFVVEIKAHPMRWFTQLIVSPAFAAVLWSYIERKAWATGLFAKLGLPPQSRHPNAIQAALWAHRDSNPVVKILLKDKVTTIVGVWAPNSAATHNKGWPDLFLSQVYRAAADGTWVLDEQCTGIYIPGSEIRIAQFFKPDSPSDESVNTDANATPAPAA